MITVRYSPPADLELSGSGSDLDEMQRVVLRVANGAAPASIDADAAAVPAPYQRCLARIDIHRTQGLVCVRVDGAACRIEGGRDGLAGLASLLKLPDGSHVHGEHHAGHRWLAPESTPLVIARRDLGLSEALHTVVWKEPWIAARGDHHLLAQIRRESGHGHVLAGETLAVLARRMDNDDVLLAVGDPPRALAVVHLTWATSAARDASYPWTTLFASLAEFERAPAE